MVSCLIMWSLMEKFVSCKLANFFIKSFMHYNICIKWGFAIGKKYLWNWWKRNLRPENVLLDENNNLKITNFTNSNTFKPGALLKTGN